MIGIGLLGGLVMTGINSTDEKPGQVELTLTEQLIFAGEVGTKNVTIDLDFYTVNGKQSNFQKVKGTLVYKSSGIEKRLVGNYFPESGNLILEASDGTRFIGKYSEDFAYVEGSVTEGDKILAFNWE